MPVILEPEYEAKWLDKNITDLFVAMDFLKPTLDSTMDEYTVSKLVNKPANDTPELIKKLL